MTRSFQHYDQIARQTATALYLYIDIETIPAQEPSVLEAIRAKHRVEEPDLDAIKPDGRLKSPSSIVEEMTELNHQINAGELGPKGTKAAEKRVAQLKEELPLAWDKIADDIAKKREKAIDEYDAALAKAIAATNEEWRKTALDASLGQIACASFSVSEGNVHSVVDARHCDEHVTWNGIVPLEEMTSERHMISTLFEAMEVVLHGEAHVRALSALKKSGREASPANLQLEIELHRQVPIVVAHFAQFDVRYIWQRAVILGVTPPAWWPTDAKPWDADRIHDTMTMWSGNGNRIGLDRLCRALGLEGKTGIDGSMVWDYVQDGSIEDVVAYCEDDVRRLRSVHRRMIGLPVLDIDAIDVPAEDEQEAA